MIHTDHTIVFHVRQQRGGSNVNRTLLVVKLLRTCTRNFYAVLVFRWSPKRGNKGYAVGSAHTYARGARGDGGIAIQRRDGPDWKS